METRSILCRGLAAVIMAAGSLYANQTLIGQPARPLIIKFDFAKADLKLGKSAEKEFAELAAELKTFPYAKLEIDGHTDAIGPQTVNDKLSMERAEAVRQHFVTQYGINSDRIVIVAHGKRLPLAPNTTRLGRQENRAAIAQVYRLDAGEMLRAHNL